MIKYLSYSSLVISFYYKSFVSHCLPALLLTQMSTVTKTALSCPLFPYLSFTFKHSALTHGLSLLGKPFGNCGLISTTTAVITRIRLTEIKTNKIQLVAKISFSLVPGMVPFALFPKPSGTTGSPVSSCGKQGWRNGMRGGSSLFPGWALRSQVQKWVRQAYPSSKLEFKSCARLGQTWKGF